MIRVLGLDNSTANTGWAVIDIDKSKKGNKQYNLVDYGTIPRKNKSLQEALALYEDTINNIFDEFKPDYISAEQMFVSKNRETAMHLAFIHAIMLLCAQKKNIPVVYYAVMTLKSKVTGGIKVKKEDGTRKSGKEMKMEVQEKVIEIIGKKNFTKAINDDITDAMSCVITWNLMDGKPVEKKKKR